MPIILDGTKYKNKKNFRNAEGDVTEPAVTPPVVAPKSNVKKYLLWGALAVGAYLLYKKYGKK